MFNTASSNETNKIFRDRVILYDIPSWFHSKSVNVKLSFDCSLARLLVIYITWNRTYDERHDYT